MSRNSEESETSTRSSNLNAIHESWKIGRKVTLDQFSASLIDWTEGWISLPPNTGDEAARKRTLLVGIAATVAVNANLHSLAADSYFTLAETTRGTGEPCASDRLWYERSLSHAQLAGFDFAIARAAYCVGVIDASEGLHDAATASLSAARMHAAQAGSAGGEAAALYRLSLLAMSSNNLSKASDYALESYVLSRNAEQYEPAAETLRALFTYYNENGVDDLAIEPALDLVSTLLHHASDYGQDTASIVAATFNALAKLSPLIRETVVRHVEERYGAEISKALGQGLAKVVSALDRGPET